MTTMRRKSNSEKGFEERSKGEVKSGSTTWACAASIFGAEQARGVQDFGIDVLIKFEKCQIVVVPHKDKFCAVTTLSD